MGVEIGNDTIISAFGQADDTGLCSNDIYHLYSIFKLSVSYCRKYNVILSPEKTKLLVIASSKKEQRWATDCFNPIKVNQVPVKFVNEAKHVGILRSVEGNLPNLMKRIMAHKKALGAVLYLKRVIEPTL